MFTNTERIGNEKQIASIVVSQENITNCVVQVRMPYGDLRGRFFLPSNILLLFYVIFKARHNTFYYTLLTVLVQIKQSYAN